MKKFFRSKLFISVILLVMAFVLVFYFVPKIYGSQRETMDVVHLVSDVKLGTRITEQMLVTKTVGKYGVESNVVQDATVVVGMYAARNIEARELLYSDMFAPAFQEVSGAIDTLIKEGQKLVSVSLKSMASSVSGDIKAGSVVDVLTQKAPEEAATDEFGGAGDQTDVIELELTPSLKGVTVYKVLNDTGADIAELSRKWKAVEEKGTDEKLDASMIPATVELIVSDEQALKLGNQEVSGTIHLVLHPNIPKAEPSTPPVIAPPVPTATVSPSTDPNVSDVTGGLVDGKETPVPVSPKP